MIESSERQATDPSNANWIATNNRSKSFETCFSSGLVISEFSDPIINGVSSASAELTEIKLIGAARKLHEEKEEAELERRMNEVLTKKNPTKTGADNELVLRAVVPQRSGSKEGRGRDNNFLQFQNSTEVSEMTFLSLVQNHNLECQDIRVSRRALCSKPKPKSKVLSSAAQRKGIHKANSNGAVKFTKRSNTQILGYTRKESAKMRRD